MYNQNSDLMKQEKFMLPTMIEGDFSAEELAEDADGLQMSFQRVKIPAGGTLQFEMPSDDPDNPDYEKTLVGVILHNHATCAYWPAGSEYDDDIQTFKETAEIRHQAGKKKQSQKRRT